MAGSEARRLIAEHAPLGILSLAAVLEERGVTASIIDLNRLYYKYLGSSEDGVERGDFCSYVIQHLEPMSFDVFGFSTICSSYPLTIRLARGVRSTHTNARIIFGGPQASVVDVQTLREFPFIDFIVRGEAETSLPLLLDAMSDSALNVAHIAGITYKQGAEVVRNPNAPVIADLDSLPMPAFHLYAYTENCSYAPLEAGRGCPFACSFCSTNDFFRRRFRMKSPELLVQQMRVMKDRYGIRSFNLVHDMFTVDKKKVMSFCQALEESGEKFYWTCSARTDCLDDELASEMARTGCLAVFFGVDTGSDRMQSIINKRLNMAEAESRLKLTSRLGIDTTLSLITGFPEETKDDLRETVRLAARSLRHPRVELQLHLLAPLAETPITTQYKEQLVYDEIFSDISFQGWEQDPEERAMITEHHDIFPNFYAVPTRWLDRHYLKELREFLLQWSVKHRWLMLLLQLDSGDLLKVFDEWRCWSPEGPMDKYPMTRTRSYYTGKSFSLGLMDFLSSHYIERSARYPHLVSTLVDVEAALFSLRRKSGPAICQSLLGMRKGQSALFTTDAVPVMADDAMVLQVKADYKRLTRCLRRKEHLDRIPVEEVTLALFKSRDEIRILQLSGLAYQLLRLCDGSRSMMEIASGFSTSETIGGVSVIKAGIYGLLSLVRQGVINIKPLTV
ncbi:MAG TPA: radical SAM protein [Pyrinomonadaceae bacterium]